MPVDVFSPAFIEFHEKVLSKVALDVDRVLLQELQKNGGMTTLQGLASIAHMHCPSEGKSIQSFSCFVQHRIASVQQKCFDLFCCDDNSQGFILIESPETLMRRKDDDLTTHTVAWDAQPEQMAKIAAGERRKA